jgi:hypothetical protein
MPETLEPKVFDSLQNNKSEPETEAELSHDELVRKFLERPSTLPENMYVTIRGFSAEAEPFARKLGQAVMDCFQVLARCMDLSGLERVIVAADYAAALAEVDRGIETNHVLAATKDELRTGVAMTPAVMRDGVLRSQILVDAAFLLAMVERDQMFPVPVSEEEFDNMNAQAHYLIAHEAGHAHDHTVIDRQLPGWILRERISDYESGPAIEAVSEYTACRLSASFGDERETKKYEETFVRALTTTRECGNQIIIAYRTHANLSTIVQEFIPLYARLMNVYSYLLGHVDGLQQRLEDAAPEAHTLIKKTEWFTGLAKRWHNAFRDGWEIYGKWNSPEEMYAPLKDIFHDLLKVGGIDVQPRPDGQYHIHIPFTPETVPGLWPLFRW